MYRNIRFQGSFFARQKLAIYLLFLFSFKATYIRQMLSTSQNLPLDDNFYLGINFFEQESGYCYIKSSGAVWFFKLIEMVVDEARHHGT